MRHALRFVLIALLFLATCGTTPGQGVKYENILLGPTGSPKAGATITVCTSGATGIPCAPTVTVYSDSGLTIPINQATNPIKTDGLGNYGFWAAPGTYTVTFSGAGVTPTASTITVPCAPNSVCPLASGIATLNPGSLSGPTVTLQTGTVGTDFNLSGAANALTLNLPTASATNRGALSAADWSAFNGKLSPFPSQSANSFYAGPSSGPPAAPNFRAMVAADVPAGNSCGTNAFANSLGAGLTLGCAQPSFSNLSGTASPSQIGTGTPAAGKYVDGGTGAWTPIPATGVTETPWTMTITSTNLVSGPCATGGQNCAETVFVNAHTIVRLTYIVVTGPSGCTTNAVLGVRDVTSATNLTTSTVTAVSGTFVDSGAISVSMTAGHTFQLGLLTTSAGCTTNPLVSQVTAVLE